MGRNYAGILGLTAFSATLLRGAVAGSSPNEVSLTAVLFLFAFAALGWMIGSIAEHTVIESVRLRFTAEMKTAEAELNAAKNNQQ